MNLAVLGYVTLEDIVEELVGEYGWVDEEKPIVEKIKRTRICSECPAPILWRERAFTHDLPEDGDFDMYLVG